MNDRRSTLVEVRSLNKIQVWQIIRKYLTSCETSKDASANRIHHVVALMIVRATHLAVLAGSIKRKQWVDLHVY